MSAQTATSTISSWSMFPASRWTAIPHDGMKLKEALKYAVQVAEALASAHAAGIVHRDLKPANVLVTDGGVGKVVDFGLAKQVRPGQPAAPLTQDGVIVGTVAYMSPEQAEGKPVDVRSDIFSFGSLLYEMVTGPRAFQHDTATSTLAAVLREEPKLANDVAEDVPPQLAQLIERCLQKTPGNRFENMHDLTAALKAIKQAVDSAVSPSAAKPKRRRRRSLGFFVTAAAAVALTAAAVWYVNLGLPEHVLRPVPLTTYPGFEGNASFSPDGIQVAFSWCKEEGTPPWLIEYPNVCNIYVKQIGVEPPSRLTDAMAKDFSPAWSPNGKWIAFLRLVSAAKLTLILIPQRGGRERILLEHDLTGVADMPPGPHLAWAPDSRWLVYSTPGREEWFLSLVALDSVEKRVLTKPPANRTGLGDTSPSISPDGRILTFSRYDRGYHLYKLRLSEEYGPQGEPVKLQSVDPPNLGATWLSDGSGIVFASSVIGENGLWRTSASSGGNPQRLPFAPTFASEPAISRQANRLAYTAYRNDSNIWRAELAGPGRKPSVPVPVISSTKRDSGPACSPDGKKIAFVSDQSGAPEVWVSDLDGTNPRQITSLGGILGGIWVALPQWSPDGQNIAVTILEQAKVTLGVINANTGALRRLPGEGKWPSWSPDGEWLYFATNRPTVIWKMRPDGGARTQITRGPDDDMPQPSADGKFIYYNKGWPRPLSIWRIPVQGGEATKIIDGISTGGQWTVGPMASTFSRRPTRRVAARSVCICSPRRESEKS
jgi:Tol biopolymer transport system component